MTSEVMTEAERKQLEEFDEWLEAKHREVCREWSAETNPEAKKKYNELLKDISAALTTPIVQKPGYQNGMRAIEEMEQAAR